MSKILKKFLILSFFPSLILSQTRFINNWKKLDVIELNLYFSFLFLIFISAEDKFPQNSKNISLLYSLIIDLILYKILFRIYIKDTFFDNTLYIKFLISVGKT